MAGEPTKRYGTALVVSGPSGVGKSTICREVLRRLPAMHFSVSCTTRSPRLGETHGVEYTFLTREEFLRRVDAGEFLEHAEVHGNLYGSLRSEVESYIDEGRDVLLDIDVQGARQVRSRAAGTPLGPCTEFVFIGPPSFAEMERRLRNRGTDSEEGIARRLANARRELAAWRDYAYLVINDTVEAAVEDLLAIVRGAGCATCRRLADPWPETGRSES